MHGDDDQIVPYADSAPLSAKLVRNGTLKTYKRLPARDADNSGRDDQPRHACIRQTIRRAACSRSGLGMTPTEAGGDRRRPFGRVFLDPQI
jgi:hypothetical protein